MLAGWLATALSMSSPECPSSEAVEQRLSALRAPDAAALWYHVDVHRSGDALVLKAVTASGDTWLERYLPARGPCDELEQAAAVVLLAWEAQLPPGSVPVPHLEKPAPSLPERSASPSRVRASAEGQLWLSSDSPTWGLAGGADFRLGGLPLFLTLEVMGQGARSIAVGDGHATWSRFSVVLGPTASLALTEHLDLTLMIGAVGGPFFISGSDFKALNNNLIDWDVGLLAQVRLLLPGVWKLRPYVGLGGVLWLRKHQAVETVVAHTVDLPWLELNPAVGLAFFP
jgi:hypothetical protein